MNGRRLLTLAALAIGIAAVVFLGGLVRGGGLAAGASSAAGSARDNRDNEGVCNQESLKGPYASHVTGSVYTPSGAEVGDIAGVTVATADGQGHISGHGWTSTNGAPVNQTVTGTYTIDPDCSGTAHLVFTPGTAVTAFIVLADHGRILKLVETDAGTVVAGEAVHK